MYERIVEQVNNLSEFNGLVSRIMNMTKVNMDALQIEESTYPAQFMEAMNVNGGDLQGATVTDYVMHFVTFFWKVRYSNELFFKFRALCVETTQKLKP